MGLVAVTLRILPEGPEVDLNGLSREVRRTLGPRLKKLEQRPFAFGLNALIATIVLDDASGGAETIEAELGRLAGVSTAESTDVTLL